MKFGRERRESNPLSPNPEGRETVTFKVVPYRSATPA